MDEGIEDIPEGLAAMADSQPKDPPKGASANEPANSAGNFAIARRRRQSQRVVLRVPVLVRTTMPDGKQVEVHSFTLSVNAHGGLLEAPLSLAAGQEITLVNPLTGKDVSCRVTRAERPTSELGTFAFQFDKPTDQFWPISFPPEDWGAVAS